jgi:DNA-binding NarL/FixJ family response regulator
MPPTVLIVDDHADFRRNARALREADGFEVAARLGEATNPPAVVLTSSRNASSYRRRLAQSALGFVAKSELSGETLAGFFT